MNIISGRYPLIGPIHYACQENRVIKKSIAIGVKKMSLPNWV